MKKDKNQNNQSIIRISGSDNLNCDLCDEKDNLNCDLCDEVMKMI
jgi:hypothetical protein